MGSNLSAIVVIHSLPRRCNPRQRQALRPAQPSWVLVYPHLSAHSAWIFAWHFKVIWLSLLLMVLLLLCLLKIALVFQGFELTHLEKLVVRLPFSVYFGWISVATIANATVFLISIHWGRFGLSPVVWTVIVLVIGAVIGILTTLRFKDFGYLLVFIWAYLGILIRHYSKFNGFGGLYPSIMITGGIAILAFLLLGTISVLATPKE